ncbi:MAG TPA: TMEM175 family protein [Nitrososphaeraceae archaeon]|nr:TMEM175 family protein [Nitrososphaeraceae archaeon]
MIHEVGDRITRDRIVTFTDGVLAIVVTLLVLEIAVPQLSPSEVETELPKRLLELLPDILSYATSFIILGFFWIAHDDLFHYIKRANRTLSWITIFYLMFIAFIPFSTALIGEYRDQEISIIVYGINIIIVLVFAYLQWEYATKEHHLVDIDLDPNLVTIISRRQFVGMILYAFGIVISFLNTQVSLALFILIPLYYLIPKKYFLIRSTKNK